MKKLCCIINMLTCLSFIYSQKTTEITPEETPITGTPSNMFFEMGNLLLVNTYDEGAPSPIKFSLGMGYTIPITTWLSFTPQGQIFSNYYLWDSDNAIALPAETENRTASVPSMLIDIPATFHFTIGSFILGVEPSVSFLLRYAYTAHNVTEDVTDDISNINSWFYSNWHFLYPSLRVSFDHFFTTGTKIGVSIAAYIPVSTFTENNFPQNFTLSITTRIFFPQRK